MERAGRGLQRCVRFVGREAFQLGTIRTIAKEGQRQIRGSIHATEQLVHWARACHDRRIFHRPGFSLGTARGDWWQDSFNRRRLTLNRRRLALTRRRLTLNRRRLALTRRRLTLNRRQLALNRRRLADDQPQTLAGTRSHLHHDGSGCGQGSLKDIFTRTRNGSARDSREESGSTGPSHCGHSALLPLRRVAHHLRRKSWGVGAVGAAEMSADPLRCARDVTPSPLALPTQSLRQCTATEGLARKRGRQWPMPTRHMAVATSRRSRVDDLRPME